MNCTEEMTQCAYVGDKLEDCVLVLYTDASFADDIKNSNSTSGAIMFILGPNTYVPLNWHCKKQGAVSHSSTESETISLDAGIRMEGIPCLNLWDQIV